MLHLLAVLAAIIAVTQASSNRVWDVRKFSNLVTFGDSYTDESRLEYFVIHNGSAPPPSTLLPEGLMTASGGRTWPRYVVQYTGVTDNNGWKPQLDLYNYAVSGACCSHKITPRDFPPVLEYQIPAFRADLRATNATVNGTIFSSAPTADNSVYALWIGTNDLGFNTFITDSQAPGKTLTDYTDCVYRVFDQLYASGARVLVLMNTIPLELTPLYANETLYGTTAANSTYWPEKPSNGTIIAEQIREYTTSVNTIFKYRTAFETRVACRYPGASFALFDTHSLINDIYNQPSDYFNGTQAPDVTGAEHLCNGDGTVCTYAFNRTSSDSFMWFDSLHPSTQTDRVIARNFVDVLNGISKYATYY